MYLYKVRFGIWLFFIGFSNLYAQDVYIIDPNYPVHDLSSSLKIYQDKQHQFNEIDVLNNNYKSHISGNEEPIFMELGPTYWGKITLLTKKPLKGWTLQFEDKKIGLPAWTKSNGKVDVYGFVDDSLIFHKKTGVEYPKIERDVDSHWVLNQISLGELPTAAPVTLIIKAEGNEIGYSPYFNLTARSPDYDYYHKIYQY